MTLPQQIATIGAVVLGTVLTRSLPFALFREDRPLPPALRFLGTYLPCATFGFLVVYSLKDTSLLSGAHGLPELVAGALVVVLHLWKRNMMLSMFAGTALYMLLVR